MRNRFDKQLKMLNDMLLEMGNLCESAIAASMKSVLEDSKSGSADIAQQFAEEIDHKEREIESLCLKLLLQQQPVARDLRQISAALKMIYDMERIGNQAADVSELSEFLHGSKMKQEVRLREMAKATAKMVADSVDSFTRKDLTMAQEVIDYDDVVDQLFIDIKNELITLVAKNPAESGDCVDLLMVAKYFERIGDHAVNIADWVVFSITGIHNERK